MIGVVAALRGRCICGEVVVDDCVSEGDGGVCSSWKSRSSESEISSGLGVSLGGSVGASVGGVGCCWEGVVSIGSALVPGWVGSGWCSGCVSAGVMIGGGSSCISVGGCSWDSCGGEFSGGGE